MTSEILRDSFILASYCTFIFVKENKKVFEGCNRGNKYEEEKEGKGMHRENGMILSICHFSEEIEKG